MTLLVIADDDAVVSRIRPGPVGVLISCGDLADGTIRQVAERTAAVHVLAVKGNHDSSGAFPPSIVDLHLKVITIDGVRFGGFQGSWRYKPRGNFLYEQQEVEQLLSVFPPVDVFVAHNAPRHVHDRDDQVHLGFDAFERYLSRAKPRMFVHGHQHVNRETRSGSTQVVGVFGARHVELPSGPPTNLPP
jgi:Icc-related predicted phosphoesterase